MENLAITASPPVSYLEQRNQEVQSSIRSYSFDEKIAFNAGNQNWIVDLFGVNK